jgi:DNA polymerase-3 subunit gamma/tau
MPVLPGVSPHDDNEWHELLPKLKLSGMALQLAEHCLVKQLSDDKLILLLESSGGTLRTRLTEASLQDALDDYFGHAVVVEFDVVETVAETPAQRRIRYREELQQSAERSIANDPFVQQLQQVFGGKVLPGSVRPNKTVL